MLGRCTLKKCEISGQKTKLSGFQSSKSMENTKEVDEFAEEEVWGVCDTEAKHVGSYENESRSNIVCRKGSKERIGTNNSSKRMSIPTSGNHDDENGSPRIESIPVNIPDLPQILQSENCRRVEAGNDYWSDDDNSVDGDYKERIPPHELIAKQLSRSQLTPFSVYEGAGRTLKGRDLSRVRNSIWTKTGYID